MVAGAKDRNRYTRSDRAALIRQYGQGQEPVDQMYTIAYTAAAAQLWRQHQVVYRLHPELVDALGHTDTSTRVPCSVFAQLPHPDPFIAFAQHIPFGGLPERPVAEPMVVTGMLVTGCTDHDEVCTTSAATATQLNVQLAVRVHYLEEPAATYEEFTLRLPLVGNDSVQGLVERDQHRRISGTVSANDHHLQLYRLAVSILLYLGSVNADIKPHRTPATAARGRRRGRREDPAVIDIGFDIGAALFAARTPTHSTPSTDPDQPPREHENENEPKRAVRPHLRRAHWHTYWHGPHGQQTAQLQWLHPTVVAAKPTDAARPVVYNADPRR
jgi:hypothetical protein